MQTTSPQFWSGSYGDAECAETNEKSIFRFLFWIMVDFILKFRDFLCWGSAPLNWPFLLGALPPTTHSPSSGAPRCFWNESPSHLVLGYHWLAFLNQVRVSPTWHRFFSSWGFFCATFSFWCIVDFVYGRFLMHVYININHTQNRLYLNN